jgi:hypothetical protein
MVGMPRSGSNALNPRGTRRQRRIVCSEESPAESGRS